MGFRQPVPEPAPLDQSTARQGRPSNALPELS
jgi:hypothetical protein